MVENDWIAELPDAQAEKKSERERINFVRGDFCLRLHLRNCVRAPLKMQFQQTDFQRERFLNVRMQQFLRLLQRLQIFQRLLW